MMQFANRHQKDSKHLPTSLSCKTSKSALNMCKLQIAAVQCLYVGHAVQRCSNHVSQQFCIAITVTCCHVLASRLEVQVCSKEAGAKCQ